MVARNPLFHGRWTLKRFNATVMNDIWPEVLFFTLIATMVSLVSKLTPHQLIIDTQLLTVLGTVLGLVISFRTSSAYERYQEGRQMWTDIIVASRNLAMVLWIHVPFKPEGGASASATTPRTLPDVIEKKTIINLVQAFSVSVKHFLRGEPGVYYRDLYPLVCFLPRYANGSQNGSNADLLPLWHVSYDLHPATPHHANPRSATDTPRTHPQRTASLPTYSRKATLVNEGEPEIKLPYNDPNPNGLMRRNTFDPESVLPDVHHPDDTGRALRPSRNPPGESIYDLIPLLKLFRWFVRICLKRAEAGGHRRRKKPETVESNVPLQICLALSSHIAHLVQQKSLDLNIANRAIDHIEKLQDTASGLERIRNTPLPFAYQTHLRMSLWLYLLFLPFEIYSNFGWITIPGTAFASFLLLGFLEIGQEIENPFNYDLNDLNLDHFCLSIQRELHEITAYTSPDPTSYIFNHWNQPLFPSDRRNAHDIIRDGSYNQHPEAHELDIKSIRTTLVKNWREINTKTRDTGREAIMFEA